MVASGSAGPHRQSLFSSGAAALTDSPSPHLIVTLPAEARTSRRRIAKEISKVLRVRKTARQKKNSRIIYVEVESAAGAHWFCLEKNGRLTVDGCQARIDTAHTAHCQWEVSEGPSPQRYRPPSLSVPQLRNIFHIYEELCYTSKSVSPLEEDGLPIETSSRLPRPNVQPDVSSGLGLAPPYHLLPDTPYFRTAWIVPPPVFPAEGLSLLQRITNRYLASIQQQDDRDEEQLHRWLTATDEYYYLGEEEQQLMAEEQEGLEAVRRALGWSPWDGSRTRDTREEY